MGSGGRGGMGLFLSFIGGGAPPVGCSQETQGCRGVGAYCNTPVRV
ncbi:MAG: hypothetical protein DSM106950_37130 [Stigonema ocellatum SAG 48.90 = DSM 106950]|nr:hypothetical protein [Stigonema ocellatum SAG 48.90 = DSM 106950]